MCSTISTAGPCSLARRTLGPGARHRARLVGRPATVRHPRLWRDAPFEEGDDRHVEDGRDLEQPTASDAVFPIFVFLDLLERNADLPAELRLRYPAILAEHSNITTDQLVDVIAAATFPHSFSPLTHRSGIGFAQVEAKAKYRNRSGPDGRGGAAAGHRIGRCTTCD